MGQVTIEHDEDSSSSRAVAGRPTARARTIAEKLRTSS
jgi:hypothetical protein